MPPIASLLGGHPSTPQFNVDVVDWSGSFAKGTESILGEALIHPGLVLPGEIAALAVDPVQGFFAVGTSSGAVHLFGSPAVHLSWTLKPAQPVQYLLFKPGTPLLVCADGKGNLSIYDLSRPDPAAQAKAQSQCGIQGSRTNPSQAVGGRGHNVPHPDTPSRIAAHVARNTITCLHLSPSHSHLLLGLRDGTVDTYDLDRLAPAPFRIPNCWYEEEEMLRKSHAVDAPSRRHVPLIVDMAHSPHDLNLLLLAYEGGAVLLNIREMSVLATFSLRLLPGAPGAGGISPDVIWTERASPVTCVAWRPDASIFALGHEDGLMSFWSPSDDSKPLLVRSLSELDLDKPTVEELGPRPPREPIFKLAWAGFPAKSWLGSLSTAAEAQTTYKVSATSAATDFTNDTTILSILGGAVAGQDPPGVACITFPPSSFSSAGQSLWGAKERAPDVINRTRQTNRASLIPLREGRILANGVVQDFVLLPRSSPHYSMAWDPCAIVMLTEIPHGLPPLAPPAAQRGLMAAAFPPIPAPGSRSRTTSIIPSPLEPSMSATGPSVALSSELSAPQLLSLPFALSCSGAGAIVGAQLLTLPLATYRKLVGAPANRSEPHNCEDEVASLRSSRLPPLPIRGGIAAAQAETVRLSKGNSKAPGPYQLLLSHHLDGSIRFADISPHLLSQASADTATAKRNEGAAQPLQGRPIAADQFLHANYPLLLPHLEINVPRVLLHPSQRHHPRLSRYFQSGESPRIASVHFAIETLELSIVLSGGLLLHYRYGQARFSRSDDVEAEIQAEMQRERSGAEHAAYTALGTRMDRTSISGNAQVLQEREELDVGNALEGDMRSALQDLDTPRGGSPAPSSAAFPISTATSSLGAPPPRPKRDPKRDSILRRFRRQDEGGKSDLSVAPSTSFQDDLPSVEPTGDDNREEYQVGDEFTDLNEINNWSEDGFKANLLIDMGRGEISQLAHSDIGFLAIAYGAGLVTVDLRGPDVLLREGLDDDFAIASPTEKGREGRSARRLLEAESKAPIISLAWTICRLPGAKIPGHGALAPRLVIGRSNGLVTVWTLTHALSMWVPERTGAIKVDELDGDNSRPSQLIPRGSLQVWDVVGNRSDATPLELQRAIREQGRSLGREEDMLLSDVPLLFGWRDRTLFLRSGLLGPRIAKADTSEAIITADLVEHHGEKIVVAISKISIRVYSAPRLELIQRIQRHGHDSGERTTTQGSLSIDRGPSGLFLEVLSSLDVRLWTFFSQASRPLPPSLLLYTPASMPAHPGASAVTSVASWFSTKAATTSSLDDVFAGPHRPEAPKLPPVKTKEKFLADLVGESALDTQASTTTSSGSPSFRTAPGGQSRGNVARLHATASTVAETQGTSDQMGWNLDLARRRGEAMQGLENSLASLEKSTTGWVKESKSALIKSAAKDKLSKFGL